MTIPINVPVSAADQLRAQFQPYSAKSLIYAKNPGFLMSYHLANSVSSAKQLSEAYARLNQPAMVEPIRDARIAARLTLPLPAAPSCDAPVVPDLPMVRTPSKAAQIVECTLQRLGDRRNRDADRRHRVELVVDLPLGGSAFVTKMSATEDGLIRVCGIDVEGFDRECFFAPEAIQYEIATIKVPPPGAKLTLVD